MTPITLTINGRSVQAQVEPRTHLGDFLRDACRLTGTHLGCEHGVCGACTVLIDGAPARSCIAYAVGCDGQDVRTIEGFESDAVMAELREAFSREHGLQCGFCTPGMLIAARDLVIRLPDADEKRIRVELSGNLCRCTGYVGIVNAVRSVIEARRSGVTSPAAKAEAPRAVLATFSPAAPAAVAPVRTSSDDFPKTEARKGWTRLEESFHLTKPPAEVWRAFADISAIASCLPGAELTENDGRSVKGKMTVKLGPIVAAFAGSAVTERDDANMTGTIRGAGSDGGTGSRTKGEILYHLLPDGTGTRVAVTVEYNLQGTLAQFSRSGIVQSIGRRLVEEFAARLDARMAGDVAATSDVSLDAGSLFWSWLKSQIRKLLGA